VLLVASTAPNSHRMAPGTIVAIPARDEAGSIGPCLSALAHQVGLDGKSLDGAAFGVVLLLNNCRDSTAEIARDLSRRLPYAADIGDGAARGRFAGKTKPSGSSVITRPRWDRCSAIARCFSGSTSAISSSNVIGTTPSGSALAQTIYSSIHDGLDASLAACRQIAAAALWSPCLSFADGRTRVFGFRL
jgi:hypothetical protein